MNLLRLRRTLAVTEEGHALLDEKRRVLISEFTRRLDAARKAQAEAERLLAEAYSLTARAETLLGMRALASVSAGVPPQAEIEVRHARVMGVSLPMVEFQLAPSEPQWSPLEGPLVLDEAAAKWREVLSALAALAETKTALLRLGREIQKTMRKVNAIEKIHLPQFRQAIKEISERLDEEGREAFALLKQVKERREKRGQDGG